MWLMVTTMTEQARQYTRQDLKRVQNARQMQHNIMHPSDPQLGKSVLQYLTNCPITKGGVAVAADIFGPNLGHLKGKTIHQPNPHVEARINLLFPMVPEC
jgi:hypothetical protein